MMPSRRYFLGFAVGAPLVLLAAGRTRAAGSSASGAPACYDPATKTMHVKFHNGGGDGGGCDWLVSGCSRHKDQTPDIDRPANDDKTN